MPNPITDDSGQLADWYLDQLEDETIDGIELNPDDALLVINRLREAEERLLQSPKGELLMYSRSDFMSELLQSLDTLANKHLPVLPGHVRLMIDLKYENGWRVEITEMP